MSKPAIRRLRGAYAIVDDFGGNLVRPLTRAASHPAMIATVVLLVSLGTLVRVATTHRPFVNAANPQVFGLGGDSTLRASALKGIKVAELKRRYQADILVTSTNPMSPAQIARARAAAGNGPSLTFATGPVSLGRGATQAIGVDPSTFRSFAPRGTAEFTPLWQVVQRGDVAVAHTVGRALNVALGGATIIGHGSVHQIFDVGAYATTGLPGVGVVVNQAQSHALGLTERSGLILSVSGLDASVATTYVRQALPSMVVSPVHIALSQDGKLRWVPPAIGRISSGFGPRDGRFHEGLDFAANYGAPVYAAADGYVLYAGPAIGFGNEIVLQHSNGVVTVYGHMERILITYGRVSAGTAIALVGSEGDSTGPHLHFEVHLNDRPIDPYIWLRDQGVKFTP